MKRIPTRLLPCILTLSAVVLGPLGTTTVAQVDPASPLGGGWVLNFSSPVETFVNTLTFTPLDPLGDRYSLTIQAAERSQAVFKGFPEVDHLTDFVGTAVRTEPNLVEFTTIGYGIDRTETGDEVEYISLISGSIILPPEEDPAVDPNQGPISAEVDASVSYYVPEQDSDRDGFPDTCNEVICHCYLAAMKRVEVVPPCEETESFVALLGAVDEHVEIEATGRAFMKLSADRSEASFIVTVRDANNVTAANIYLAQAPDVPGEPVVQLFPTPLYEAPRSDTFIDLLSCGTFGAADLIGPLEGLTLEDLLTGVDENRVYIRIDSEENPDGLIIGQVQDP